MLIDPNAVTEEESAASTETVNDADATAAAETVEQEQTEESTQEVFEAVDEHGIPWKNRAMELQRKMAETVDNLPRIVEETIAKTQVKPAESQKYTFEQLEQIAIDRPELRPQVEAEKEKLREARLEAKNKTFLQEIESKKQADVAKYQAEQWVLNHPKFKECFVDSPNGKQWNMAHPLSQIIAQTMNNPDIKGRPDALAVAARVAYGDYMLQGEPKVTKQVKTLQGQLKQTQKKTLIEGNGQVNTQGAPDDFAKARDELRRTGSRRAAEDAVKLHLKKSGLLPA
jgi:hypothetical protein